MWHKRRKLNNQIDYKLFVSILFATIGLIGTTECPVLCKCKWTNGKQAALCDQKQLNSIPIGIPSSTQVLNMSDNNLQTLPVQVFRERGLINLQKLFLAKCKLGSIAEDAFLQLTNLVEIDLCDNSLEYIPTVSLQKCKSLRKLSLSSNPIGAIRSDSFWSLHHLVTIDLSLCRIESIDSNAFKALNELRYLRLDSNRLRSLAANALTDLQVLHEIDLHSNRWHCDCHLKQSVQWLQTTNIPQTVWPKCSTPVRLEGYSWNALNLEEFSCSPLIHTQLTDLHTNIGQNITIYCTVSGFPLPSITWKVGFGNVSLNDDKRVVIENQILNETFVLSYITINDLRLEDSQQLICLASNKGGTSHQNFSLTVMQTSKTNAAVDWTKFRITCYIFGLVLALIFVAILFLLPLIRAKKYASIRSSKLSPKLGPIDILQNCKNSEMEMKNIFSNKPEIALISDIIKDTKDMKAYSFGSDALTPDVTKSGSHYSVQPQHQLSNHSSTLSSSHSFDTFHKPPKPPKPPLLVLDSSDSMFLFNNQSNNCQQLESRDNRDNRENRVSYVSQNPFKFEPNCTAGANCANSANCANGVNECQKLFVLSTTRTQTTVNDMSGLGMTTDAGAQQLKPFLSHSTSHALELDKELLVCDLKATQNLLNSNNSISVTQV